MHDLPAELSVCVCVLCEFTVDIADKPVSSDWTYALELSACESANEDGISV